MLILGAGGHAKEVLDILTEQSKFGLIRFFDDTQGAPEKINEKFDVIFDENGVVEFFKAENSFSLGVGDPALRYLLAERIIKLGGQYIPIIANSSTISKYSTINGDIMHQVFVGSNSEVGRGTLINTGSQVHHDVIVGEFVELSPKVVLLGKSQVGGFCRIGASATILPGISIGDNVVIGAGAVVTKNIPSNSLAVGVPAKVIKSIK